MVPINRRGGRRRIPKPQLAAVPAGDLCKLLHGEADGRDDNLPREEPEAAEFHKAFEASERHRETPARDVTGFISDAEFNLEVADLKAVLGLTAIDPASKDAADVIRKSFPKLTPRWRQRLIDTVAGKNGEAENGKNANGASPARTARTGRRPADALTVKMIPVGKIKPFEFQMRRTFAKLEELGASIKKFGQLQDALVRIPVGGTFELIAGERRWRACKLAGVHELRCRVIDVTDEEAIDIAGTENLEREDLNPIEEALWLKLMIEKGGHTQESLAKRFRDEAEGGASAKGGSAGSPRGKKGKGPTSQGQISNRLRLLELPPLLQEPVVDGRLPASYARTIVPYANVPGFDKEFLQYANEEHWRFEPLSDGGFYRDIASVLRGCCEEVEDYKDGHRKLALAHREELGLVELTWPWGDSRSDLYVPKAGQKRWAALLEELKASQQTKADRKEAKSAKEAKELTPAQRKAKAKQRDDQLARRQQEWFYPWWRSRIVAWLDEQQNGLTETLDDRLVLFFALDPTGFTYNPWEGFREACKQLGIAKKTGSCHRLANFASVSRLTRDELRSVRVRLFREWIAEKRGRAPRLDNWELVDISQEMSLDVAAEWARCQPAVLESFLEETRPDKAQLGELAVEWGVLKKGQDFGESKRSEAIAQILDAAKNRKFTTPAILLELAKAKR